MHIQQEMFWEFKLVYSTIAAAEKICSEVKFRNYCAHLHSAAAKSETEIQLKGFCSHHWQKRYYFT